MSENFPFGQYYVGEVLDEYSYSKGGFQKWKEVNNVGKPAHLYELGDGGNSGDTDLLSSDLMHQAKATDRPFLLKYHQAEQEQPPCSADLDAFFFNTVFPTSCQEKIQKLTAIESVKLIEPHGGKQSVCPSSASAVLEKCRNWFKTLNDTKPSLSSAARVCTKEIDGKLSTNAIIRLGGESFIQSSATRIDDNAMLCHPFGSSFFGLSDRLSKDVGLIEHLLASAEKVGQQQFERASYLLKWCEELSSTNGNPVQRLAYYFSKALGEKIGRETRRNPSNNRGMKWLVDIERQMMTPDSTILAYYRAIPLHQVSQFAGMQAIVESTVDAKKVHIIDLFIRGGTHCTILMQALASRAECPLEHLKITAIGTKLKHKIEETGDRLMCFAHSIGLSFSFNVVMVGDILDLKEDLFQLDAEEAVAVHSSHALWPMIAQSDRLEYLVRVIRNINPCVMIVTESAANLNSPVFVNRFIEALFFYGAFFESLEDCMDPSDPNRITIESVYFRTGIWNIVADEGEDRTIRHVNINVWRKFFARFQMVEVELSTSSLYQASLITNTFACGSSCTLDMDEKCLIIGWKGTPVEFLSAWKFV